MAVRTNNAYGDNLERTTALPTAGAFTMMAWFWFVSIVNGNGEYGMGVPSAGVVINGSDGGGANGIWNGTAWVTGTTLSTSTWYHRALIVAGTGAGQAKAYLNGVLDVTNGGNTSTPTSMRFGGLTNNPSNCRMAGMKVWDAILTVAEIQQEMYSLSPRRVTNLNVWTPGFPGLGERSRDYSGLGNNWTPNGTLTDEDPPPVSYGGRSWLVYKPAPAGAGPIGELVAARQAVNRAATY